MFSENFSILAGVPQAAILSPTLYIYTRLICQGKKFLKMKMEPKFQDMLTILIYGIQHQIKKLEIFHKKCLKICFITHFGPKQEKYSKSPKQPDYKDISTTKQTNILTRHSHRHSPRRA